jgi:hypothetical protein
MCVATMQVTLQLHDIHRHTSECGQRQAIDSVYHKIHSSTHPLTRQSDGIDLRAYAECHQHKASSCQNGTQTHKRAQARHIPALKGKQDGKSTRLGPTHLQISSPLVIMSLNKISKQHAFPVRTLLMRGRVGTTIPCLATPAILASLLKCAHLAASLRKLG